MPESAKSRKFRDEHVECAKVRFFCLFMTLEEAVGTQGHLC